MDVSRAPYWQQKQQQVETGAALGGTLGATGGALARAVTPRGAADVATLRRAGVTPTPGQVAGGGFRAVEERVGPFVPGVTTGQANAVEDLNRAVYNRALAPLGETLPKNVPLGHDALAYVGDKIGNAYDTVLSKITVRPDAQFVADIRGIAQRAQNELKADNAQRFARLMQRQISRAAMKGNEISGREMKTTVSEFRALAHRYMRAPGATPDDLTEAQLLRAAADAFKKLAGRTSPEHAPALAAADKAWSIYKLAEDAVGRPGTQAAGGIFTPAQIDAAVRRSASRASRYARGLAPMQDLTGAAVRTLSNRTTASPVSHRLWPYAALLYEGHNILPFVAAHPEVVPAALMARLAYTRPGARLAAALMAGGTGQNVAEAIPYAASAAGFEQGK